MGLPQGQGGVAAAGVDAPPHRRHDAHVRLAAHRRGREPAPEPSAQGAVGRAPEDRAHRRARGRRRLLSVRAGQGADPRHGPRRAALCGARVGALAGPVPRRGTRREGEQGR